MRRAIIVVCVAIVGASAGCGDEQLEPEARVAARSPLVAQPHERQRVLRTTCARAGRLQDRPLELCQVSTKADLLSEFRIGRDRIALDVELPFPKVHGHVPGHWRWAAASPDGETILAQWSGECEVPKAFFVDADGGSPRSVTGPYSRTEPPVNSVALGWTTDGRAIVFVPELPGCGHSLDSGVFLIDPSGVGPGERIGGAPHPRQPPPLDVSRAPRREADLRSALR